MANMIKNVPNWLVVMALVVVVAAGLSVVTYVGLGLGKTTSGNTAANTVYTKASYDYAGNTVNYDMKFYNKYTGGNVSPTCYIYGTQPTDWENGRATVQSGYVQTGATSDGTKFQLAQLPGTYYVRCTLSGYYNNFQTIVVPSSGDVALSDYNSAPKTALIYMLPADTASTSNLDLTITANSSTELITSDPESITITTAKSYCLDDISLLADDVYMFNKDADGDGVYNEGISKLELIISADTLSAPISWVPFNSQSGINEFGQSQSATAVLKTFGTASKIVLSENQGLTISNKVTSSAQHDDTGAADEKLGNGEDFVTVTLLDCLGTSATYTLTA